MRVYNCNSDVLFVNNVKSLPSDPSYTNGRYPGGENEGIQRSKMPCSILIYSKSLGFQLSYPASVAYSAYNSSYGV